MKYHVITSPTARSNIDERLAFVSQTFPEYADVLASSLFDAINELSFAPYRHKRGCIEGTRESISVKNYVIVFSINEIEKTVEVLHVYHQKQKR